MTGSTTGRRGGLLASAATAVLLATGCAASVDGAAPATGSTPPASLSPAAAGDPPAVRGRTLLFRAPYVHSVSVNYDVSPDGTRFVVVIGRVHANRLVVALHAVPVGTGDSRRR